MVKIVLDYDIKNYKPPNNFSNLNNDTRRCLKSWGNLSIMNYLKFEEEEFNSNSIL